ncbi:hypothetical protein CVO76_12725 [Arthrobacter agilis]|uniref:GmrSD restriction endonucleases N-terminal domain-containing protein n=1 Tax=Arthrobacter agilis TaxID=37921 RepID=A0A2L0UGN1_9MICC|nr:DUF262 domain-containing protein [Arthrobacter agilis]AUZ88403.1 hypothetical protein CVO76_12725 [Arthrobacter agilis]
MQWPDLFDDDNVDDDDLSEMTRKYLPDTVVWTTDWTTGSLIEQLERNVFNVDPPFQRRSAWSDTKASLYIESLLLGCPVPPVTLAELPAQGSEGNFQYVVIDGKQRLTTLKRFALDGELKLTGLKVLRDLNGRSYSEVEQEPEFRRFANLPVRTVVLRNWKKDEVLQFVFHRLNTQTTPLSTHELRRALLAGGFTDYLDRESASSEGLQRILGISEPDYRLRDAELLLRAIAFVRYSNRYKGNLKQFLDTITRSANRSWSEPFARELDEVVGSINSAISAVYDIFDKGAFQRIDDEGQPSGRFNRAVFDILVMTFQNETIRRAATADPQAVRSAFTVVNRNPDFKRFISGTTKTPEAVNGRLRIWWKQLSSALELPYESFEQVQTW